MLPPGYRGEDVHGVPGERAAGVDPAAGPAGLGVGCGLASGEGGQPGDPGGAGRGIAAGLGDLDDDLVRLRPDGQAGDAGLLDQVRGGADQAHVGGQRGVPARGGGGHGVISAAFPGRTASLVTVPGRGMTFANDAGPRRNAAAPPSPAAAGSVSRSVPAARMPLTVR